MMGFMLMVASVAALAEIPAFDSGIVSSPHPSDPLDLS